MNTRSIAHDRPAGAITVKWVKKLRVETGDASLLSGDKCKEMFSCKSERGAKRKKNMFALVPRQDSGVSGLILLGSLTMPRLRLREKNNSGLIIEDDLGDTVPHTGGASCVAQSMSCRGIAEKTNRQLRAQGARQFQTWSITNGSQLVAFLWFRSCAMVVGVRCSPTQSNVAALLQLLINPIYLELSINSCDV